MPDFADSDATRYQLIDHISADPLSVVYLAYDSETGHNVVLRCCTTGAQVGYPLAPALRTALISLRYLRHPNILLPLNFWEEDDQLFIVQPAAASATLRHRSSTSSGPDLAIQIGHRMAEALEFVHRRGTLHLALTPDTIVFDERDEPMLVDLEVGRFLASTAWLVGIDTPALYPYLAPEIFQGSEPSVQSDLYMLGAILYELLAGMPPSLSSALPGPEGQAPAPLAMIQPDCPAQLANLVMELIQPVPADRPRSAAEVAARLDTLGAGRHEPEESDSPDTFGFPTPSGDDLPRSVDRRAVVIASWLRWGFRIAVGGVLALLIIGLIGLKVLGFMSSLGDVPNRASQVMFLLAGLVGVGVTLALVVPRMVRAISSSSRSGAGRGDPELGAFARRSSLSLALSVLLSFLRSDDEVDFDDSWLDQADDIVEDTSFQLLGEFNSGGSLHGGDSYPRRRQEL